MTHLAGIRTARRRSPGALLAAVALAWLAVLAPACVMGLDGPAQTMADAHAEHADCPHCPPTEQPGAAANCEPTDPLPVPRSDLPVELPTLAGLPFVEIPAPTPGRRPAAAPPPLPVLEPTGPRPHLQHAQFNE